MEGLLFCLLSIANPLEVARIRRMPSLTELRKQIDAIDRQIVELLGRRTKLAAEAHRIKEDEDDDAERQQQVLSNWLEEGFDFDLEEAGLEKVAKSVLDMGKKAKELA